MNIKDKLFWFTVKELKTEKYIYERQIEVFDYALFLNEFTSIYIEAECATEVEELLIIQRMLLE